MKTLIAAAAAAVALTAPAFAQITDVEAHFASEFTSNDAKIYDGVPGNVTDRALELHAQIFAEDESNNRSLVPAADDLRFSTRGVVNDVAADLLAQIKAESLEDE